MAQTIRISPGLQERLDAAYDASHLLGDTATLDGAEFWEQAAKADTELAAVWHAVRQELNPQPGSVLLRLLLDAERYRKDGAAHAQRQVADYDRA